MQNMNAMMAAPGAAQSDPAGSAPGQDDDEGQGGFTIEINVDGQGQITVGIEDAGAESQEDDGGDTAGGEGPDDDTSDMQPAKNIKDALQIAMRLYQQGGAKSGDQLSVEQAFDRSFNGQPQG